MRTRVLIVCAGLLGAAGVAVGAAGSHMGGGEFSRLSSEFLLFHAAAVPGLLALPAAKTERVRVVATSLLVVGAFAFSGDLALLAFAGGHGIPGLAPAGGLALIAGWLSIALSGFLE